MSESLLRPGACGRDGHSLNEYPLGAWPFSEKWEEVMGARGGHVAVKYVRNLNNGGAGAHHQGSANSTDPLNPGVHGCVRPIQPSGEYLHIFLALAGGA